MRAIPSSIEPLDGVVPYFEKLGHPCPPHTNPADHVIGIINTDFSSSDSESPPGSAGNEKPHARLKELSDAWREHTGSQASGFANGDSSLTRRSLTRPDESPNSTAVEPPYEQVSGLHRDISRTLLLMQRMGINYRRNLLAYGVRIAMYAGMGFLLATIWVHLGTRDNKINDRLSVGFMFEITSIHRLSVSLRFISSPSHSLDS